MPPLDFEREVTHEAREREVGVSQLFDRLIKHGYTQIYQISYCEQESGNIAVIEVVGLTPEGQTRHVLCRERLTNVPGEIVSTHSRDISHDEYERLRCDAVQVDTQEYRAYLDRRMQTAAQVSRTTRRSVRAPKPETPLCFHCDSPMVRRTNRETQKPFWGCSLYPRCRGTRKIRG